MLPPLPEAFLRQMARQLGDSYPDFVEAMTRPARRGLRLNALKPLPLMGPAAAVLGQLDAQGNIALQVTVRMDARPGWATGSPDAWIGEWE